MHLYLIRHGACEGAEKPDPERALTSEGITDIKKVAAHVTAVSPQPTCIFASPLKRAIQTAELFQVGWDLPIEKQDWLLPAVSPSEVLEALKSYSETDCALIGHLPNLGLLLGTLVWGAPSKEVIIPKGGAAHLIVKSLDPGAAKLRWLITPDSLNP